MGVRQLGQLKAIMGHIFHQTPHMKTMTTFGVRTILSILNALHTNRTFHSFYLLLHSYDIKFSFLLRRSHARL